MNATIRIGALLASLLLTLPAFAAPITATLALKGKMTMDQLAQNVQNPASDHYNRFYEPNEIRQLAGPADADYNDLLKGLKAEGLTVVSESPTHLWVRVRGEKAIFESLFSTQVQMMANGTHKHLSAVQVPIHLSLIQSVSGLDSTRKSHPHYRKVLDTPSAAGGLPMSTIRTAYGMDSIYASGLTGKGQDIAVATYDGYKIANVKKFYSLIGLSPAPSIDTVNFNGTATYNEGSAGETELDTEFIGMTAPGASIHVFASASNDDDSELAMFTAIMDDNRSKIVNYSWGGCETSVTPEHKSAMEAVFQRAVAQGVSIFNATGDSGSDSCQDGTTVADWPAATPYVVAVGGTTLNFDSSNNASETGWADGGGGVSALFTLPAWQQNMGAGFSFTGRGYPDVAFNADPNSGQAIYTGSSPDWAIVGGTSMASPQWAGYLALVNEARMNAGKQNLGYLTPFLYAMSAKDRSSTMNDVTSGNNGAYSAAAGWDAVTGWGSMKGQALLTYLSNL